MSYTPRPGSKADRAIQFIKRRGCARSGEIAQALQVHTTSVASMLALAVEAGVLVACSVQGAKGQKQTEYRPSGSFPAPARDLPAAPSARDKAAPAPKQRRSAPAAPRNVQPSAAQRVTRLRLALHDDGRLDLTADGATLTLTRAQTTQLAKFLGCFQGVDA